MRVGTSLVTASDPAMDGKDIMTTWAHADYSTFDNEDNASTFGRAANPWAMMDGIYRFGDNDDSFMDGFFDFERVSSSPETQTSGLMSIPSPRTPNFKIASLKKPKQAGKGKTANGKAQGIVSAAALIMQHTFNRCV